MDYLEGVVPADMRAMLESHVAGCPKCEAFIASYLATPRILRDATAAAMPPELQRSLLAFLRAQRGEGPERRTEREGSRRRAAVARVELLDGVTVAEVDDSVEVVEVCVAECGHRRHDQQVCSLARLLQTC